MAYRHDLFTEYKLNKYLQIDIADFKEVLEDINILRTSSDKKTLNDKSLELGFHFDVDFNYLDKVNAHKNKIIEIMKSKLESEIIRMKEFYLVTNIYPSFIQPVQELEILFNKSF